MEKLFNCPVHAQLPNDYFSLHRVVTLGQPLGGEANWARRSRTWPTRLIGRCGPDRKKPRSRRARSRAGAVLQVMKDLTESYVFTLDNGK